MKNGVQTDTWEALRAIFHTQSHENQLVHMQSIGEFVLWQQLPLSIRFGESSRCDMYKPSPPLLLQKTQRGDRRKWDLTCLSRNRWELEGGRMGGWEGGRYKLTGHYGGFCVYVWFRRDQRGEDGRRGRLTGRWERAEERLSNKSSVSKKQTFAPENIRLMAAYLNS